MNLDIESLLKTAAENLNLKDFKGDIVLLKQTENDFGTIEAGGIGIQNNYYGSEVKNEESCGLSCSNLFTDKDGIKDAGDMWLLLVAAEARKKQFDNLPKFVDWAFDNFNVPFDKEECKTKIHDKMKSQPWSTVSDQSSMKKFIEKFRAQPNKRKSDMKRANAIFVAIKEKTIGEN